MRKLCCGRAKKEIMPDRCVAANCGNIKDKESNISMHRFPFYGDTRPEAQKRRKRWVDWVKLKRAKWEPSVHSHLCSVHFKPEEFMLQFGNEVDLSKKWLLKGRARSMRIPQYTQWSERKTYIRELQAKLFELWDQYEAKERSAKSLLKACSHLNGPRES